MKYSDFRSHKVLRQRVRVYAVPVAFVLIALGLVLVRAEVPAAVSSAGHDLVRPLWSGKTSLLGAVHAAYESLESKEALVRENMSLHEELSALRRASFDAELLRLENERLRTLVGRAPKDSLVASVLTGTVSTPYDLFIVDVGLDAGAVLGSLVTTPEGAALGTVTGLFARSAAVTMFSAPGYEVPVLLGATTTVRATAIGRGSGVLEITLPRDVPVRVGDPVVLQTIEIHRLGSVRSIDVSPEDATQRLFVDGDVYLTGVRHVLVHPMRSFEPRELSDTSTPTS